MLEIDFIGYSAVHPSDFVFDVPDGLSTWLLLLTASPARFDLDEKQVYAPPGSAILYTPGSRIYYCASGEEYKNDWVRFRCDHSFVEQFPVKNTPFPVSDPEYCHSLFKLLTWESSFSASESETNISHLMRVLFSKMRESILNDTFGIHSHELVALHKRIYNNPQFPWNVSQMAEDLHLSASYIQTLYRKMFGISCMDDVIESRLRHAQDLLKYTEYSVGEIAEKCGYNNVEHFCRQFRQHISCTPGQYRKALPQNECKNPPTHNNLGGREFRQTL